MHRTMHKILGRKDAMQDLQNLFLADVTLLLSHSLLVPPLQDYLNPSLPLRERLS